MIKLFKRLKQAYPKCRVQEEKNYVSFSLGGVFVYELRIQQEVIRLLATNYPSKAGFEECFKIIKQYKIDEKTINRHEIIFEAGVRSEDKFTLRVEIPYKKRNLTNEEFIGSVIQSCEKFHKVLMPLVSNFQNGATGSLSELMSDDTPKKKMKEPASSQSIQSQIASAVCKKYKDAVVKKVDKDNYLDIHLPSINEKKGTHLGVNTAKDLIRLVFYCRDAAFVEELLSESEALEEYSQGVRPASDPIYSDVKSAVKGIFKFIEELAGSKPEDDRASSEEDLETIESEPDAPLIENQNQENSQNAAVRLQDLIHKNIFFNLYNPDLISDKWEYDSDSFEEWDSIHKNKKLDYRNNFYGLVFPTVSNDIDSELTFGFINSKGEKISKFELESASKIVNGLSVVKKAGQWYIFNIKENKYTELNYDDVSGFSEGLALVMNEDGKYGYINEQGKEVIKCTYNKAEPFSEGIAKVGKGDFFDEKYGFIDQKGKKVIPLKYDFTIENAKEGFICVSSDTNYKYGYLDLKGNQKIPFIFDLAISFSEGLARVKQKDAWGFIDSTGKIVIPCSFDACSDFSNGLALVKKEYDTYFINAKGEKVISCDDYTEVNSFSNNLAAVSKADKYGQNIKWGFIDQKGKLVIKCNYDEVSDFYKGFANVKKNDSWAIINMEGKLLCTYEYKSISTVSENTFVVGIPATKSALDIRDYLLSFFNNEFGNEQWQGAIYPQYNHKPSLGIYNAGTKELLALGLGRKDRLFTLGINFQKNQGTILSSLSEAQLKSFTQYDYAGLVKEIINCFEEIGSLHEDASYTDDDEEREGLMNDYNDEIEKLRELIPSLPDITELSPGDF